MPITVNAASLTTLATAKTVLNVSGATDDEVLSFAINAASEWLEAQCGRKFSRSAAEVEEVGGFGYDALVVSRTPIRSLTGIKYDGSALDVTNVKLDKDAGLIERTGGWTWTAHSARDTSMSPVPGTERRLFEVTYDGGWVTPGQESLPSLARTLPTDLEAACIEVTKRLYYGRSRDPSVASEKLLSWAASYASSQEDGFGPLVRATVNRYRRIV